MVFESDSCASDCEHKDDEHQNPSGPDDRTRHAGMVVWIHTYSILQALEVASIGHRCEDWTIRRGLSENM